MRSRFQTATAVALCLLCCIRIAAAQSVEGGGGGQSATSGNTAGTVPTGTAGPANAVPQGNNAAGNVQGGTGELTSGSGPRSDGTGAARSAQPNTTPVTPNNAGRPDSANGTGFAPATNGPNIDAFGNPTRSTLLPGSNRSPASGAAVQFPNTVAPRRANRGLRTTRPVNPSTVFPDGGTNILGPRNGIRTERNSQRNGGRQQNGSPMFYNSVGNGDRGQQNGFDNSLNAPVNGIPDSQSGTDPDSNGDVQFFTTDGSQPFSDPARGWLGVYFSPEYAGSGARISRLAQASPAVQAGLRPGDVIVALNGQDIYNYQDVMTGVGRLNPHATAELFVARNGRRIPIVATVGTLQQAGFRGTNTATSGTSFVGAATTPPQQTLQGYSTSASRVEQLELRMQEFQNELRALRSELGQPR